MSWLDELREAEFRKVKFYVHTAESKGGRTKVKHEVPFSEKRPFKEDTGSAGRDHNVEAYLYGPDYREKLNALLTALESPDAAELNHPFIGVAMCVVDGEYTVRQSGDEGGMAVVSIPFSEVSTSSPAPAVTTANAQASVTTSVEAARVSASEVFVGSSRAVLDAPGGLLFAAAQSAMGDVSNRMQRALSRAAVPAGLLASFTRQLQVPLVKLENFTSNPAAYFPALVGSLFDSLVNAFTAEKSLAVSPVTQLLALYDLVQLANDASEEAQAITPALQVLVQRGALCAASAALVVQRFDSYDAALRGREQVIAAISRHTTAADDDSYAVWVDLRIALANAVPGVDSNLPRLQSYTPARAVPSLVLAHRLYGDVASEADLLARNRVRNPAFVPGGRPLEVLSRG